MDVELIVYVDPLLELQMVYCWEVAAEIYCFAVDRYFLIKEFELTAV
jgi:hypothetical protein